MCGPCYRVSGIATGGPPASVHAARRLQLLRRRTSSTRSRPAVDTPLPEPPERVHVFTADAPAWARPASGATDLAVERNTNESIKGWHRRHRLKE